MASFTGNPTNLLSENYIIPEDVSEKDLKLRQYLNNIATATNTKDSGIYDATETITGQRFLPTFSTDTGSNATYRSVFRKVIEFGALPNNGNKSVAHGLTFTETTSITRLYGAASDPAATDWTLGLPIPYASATAANVVEMNIDGTNVNILTNQDRTAFIRTFIVIEYMKVI